LEVHTGGAVNRLLQLLPRAGGDFYTDSHPRAADVLLHIEVADTSLSIDRKIKVPPHARHGVPDVWLVDIAHRQVLRVAEPQAGAYAVQSALNLSWLVLLHGLGEVAVELEALFGAECSRRDRWKGALPSATGTRFGSVAW
jgi:hypothetical protein